MAERVRFVQADWTADAWAIDLGGPFDVVVSNPPYIPVNDIGDLDVDVREFEPMAALVGGADGLDAYRTIVSSARDLIAEGGLLAFEVGIGQAQDVADLMVNEGFKVLEIRKDLGGIERAVVGRK